jgi:nitrogen regulatory protein PII
MKEIKAFVQPFMLQHVLDALAAFDDLPGVTISPVAGWGRTKARNAAHAVREAGHALARKSKLEVVVSDDMVDRVVDAIVRAAHTGNPGDGKVFVSAVDGAVRIRTGERDAAAL